jgi:hypothetical protein
VNRPRTESGRVTFRLIARVADRELQGKNPAIAGGVSFSDTFRGRVSRGRIMVDAAAGQRSRCVGVANENLLVLAIGP